MKTAADLSKLNARPGKHYLAGHLDDLVEAHDQAEAEALALKERIDELAAEKRRHEEHCAGIKAYLVVHQARLELDTLCGEVHRSDLGQAAPSFAFGGPPEKIPDELARIKRELDKAACKSAWERGELPKVISVTRTAYVKFTRA